MTVSVRSWELLKLAGTWYLGSSEELMTAHYVFSVFFAEFNSQAALRMNIAANLLRIWGGEFYLIVSRS